MNADAVDGMTSFVGNEAAAGALLDALRTGSLHHAWLLAGPEGIGKMAFARAAALRLLAEAADPGAFGASLAVPEHHRIARLFAAGSHPDHHELVRLTKEDSKGEVEAARSIKVDQVRALIGRLATKPALSERRVIVVDAIDDLERAAANALLKSLEEPPAGTIFLLVSHAPGRLLPTIRSRCRLLRFEPLEDAQVAAIVRRELPEASEAEVAALVRVGAGSPGRALRFAGLDLGGLESELDAIARDGDPSNARRARLAKALGAKSAAPRFAAFCERTPAFIAEQARQRRGIALRDALDAYDAARTIAETSLALSMDQATTAFELGGVVARLAERR